MATNAQHQAAWRSRRQINLTDTAEEIAAKLISLETATVTANSGWVDLRYWSLGCPEEKLHKIAALLAHHLKDKPCPKCEGKGTSGLKQVDTCDKKTAGRCRYKIEFPCPVCRPGEYAEVCGASLRKDGRYPEALAAAFTHLDDWAAAETLAEWKATGHEVKAAMRQIGWQTTLAEIEQKRMAIEKTPPNHRHGPLPYFPKRRKSSGLAAQRLG